MKNSKKLLGGLAVIASAGLMVGTTVPAHADPVRTYSAVGSDTIQDVWNALTNGTGAVAPSIASWNAFDGQGNSYTIQTKSGGAWFTRPSGSGDGVKALSASWNSANHIWAKAPSLPAGTFTGTSDSTTKYATSSISRTLNQDVDFARSSGGPDGTVGSDLTFIPFARDAVSVAVNTGTGVPTTFSADDLKAIYSGVGSSSAPRVVFNQASGPTHVYWDSSATESSTAVSTHVLDAGDTNVELHPMLPQSGSGTRKFFIASALGLSNTAGANASYVFDPGTVAQGGVAENDATVLAGRGVGALIPFSAAQWIAQSDLAPGTTNSIPASGVALASLIVSGTAQAPYSGSGTSLAPGALFGHSSIAGYDTVPATGFGNFNRDTYVVLPTVDTGSSANANQSNLFNIMTTTGYLGGGSAKTVIKKFGFGVLTYITTTADYLTQGFNN